MGGDNPLGDAQAKAASLHHVVVAWIAAEEPVKHSGKTLKAAMLDCVDRAQP